MLRTLRHFTSLEGKFQNSETSMAGQILAFEKPKVHLFYMYMALTSHYICKSSDLRRQMYFLHTSSQSMSEYTHRIRKGYTQKNIGLYQSRYIYAISFKYKKENTFFGSPKGCIIYEVIFFSKGQDGPFLILCVESDNTLTSLE